ncbi:MAG: hypothetical protein LBR99_03070 [Treponema sp.]|jgi:hypothetical protein|nr:hypothetical protein [Treponema sp.]
MIHEKAGPGLLSTRSGFNSAVGYIKKTIGIVEALESGENLSGILRNPKYGDFSGDNALPLLRMLLLDKLGYTAVSSNPAAIAGDLPALAVEFAKWQAVDLVAAFHDSPRGLLIANPKSPGQLAALGKIRARELLVVYAGNAEPTLCQGAARAAIALFSGALPDIPPELYLAGGAEKAPWAPGEVRRAKAVFPAELRGKKMTPLYSVTVTNELFHNGNVEAWKRIIHSYTAKYPGLKVHIYYQGEPILNINTLFTWGKVKHGTSIQFAVEGRDIKELSRLRRYLVRGAGSDFEALLRAPAEGGLLLF